MTKPVCRIAVPVVVVVAIVTIFSAHASAEDAAPGPSGIIAEVPYPAPGDVIILPVTIAGETYPFLLDTRIEPTTFDELLRGNLGSRMGMGPAGEDLYAPPVAAVGQAAAGLAGGVACSDLSRVREALGLDVRGILAIRALRRHVLEIDPDQLVVRLRDRVPRDSGVRQRMKLGWTGNGPPRVVGQFPGAAAERFTLDLGSTNAVAVRPMLFAALVENHAFNPAWRSTFASWAWHFETDAGVIDEVVLGRATARHVTVSRWHGESAVGLGFLTRFRCLLDFPNETLYLRPAKSHGLGDVPSDPDCVVLDRAAGAIVVAEIARECVAARAGLLPGDQIIEIDGIPARLCSSLYLGQLLGRPAPAGIRITVERGGGKLSLVSPARANDIEQERVK